MKRLIIDTCIWYALLDKTDSQAKYADIIKKILDTHQLIIPFPSLYETINTKFIKNEYGQATQLFTYLNNSLKVILIPDNNYKEKALDIVQSNISKGKHFSLVDTIIRLMMEDTSLGEIAVMTFNVGDFYGVNNTEIIDPSSIKVTDSVPEKRVKEKRGGKGQKKKGRK